MNFDIKVLNWVTTIFAKMPDSNSTTVQVLVKAGSIYETKETNWLSHFLEHMFFKWGKKYTTPKIVAETIEAFWWECNAFTSTEYAWYYVKSSPDYTSIAVDVLADMMVHAQFNHDEMEREKWVVVQEIAMYEDNPQRQVWNKQKERYYGDNSYGWPILWPASNVLSFTQDHLFTHQKALYTKDNLVVVVAGAIPKQDELEAQISELFGELPASTTLVTPPLQGYKPQEHENFFEKWTQQNHVVFCAPGFSNNDENRYAAKILWKVLGWGMSSRLFQQIREKKGLCYYVWATHSDDQADGNFLIYAWMDKAKWDWWREAIYEEITKIAAWDVSQEEFTKALWNIRWSTQMWIETSDQLADFAWYQLLFKWRVRTLPEILKDYEKVTLDEVNWLWNKLAKESLWAYWIQ